MDFLININWLAVIQIIMIDILLGSDNAVIIALACKGLPNNLRRKGIFYGTFAAITLRIIMLLCALWLLTIPGVKLIGGLLLFWIGIKMMLQETSDNANIQAQSSLLGVIVTIATADIIMSIDNVLAITAAAQNSHADHQIFLIIFGVLLSIPIILYCSTLVLKLLDRFPFLIVIGAGLLGWIAAGMIIQDTIILTNLLKVNHINPLFEYAIKALGALTVIVLGTIKMKKLTLR